MISRSAIIAIIATVPSPPVTAPPSPAPPKLTVRDRRRVAMELTIWSLEPAETFVPSADHPHLSSVFWKLCCTPAKLLCAREPFTNGRTSHERSVLSIELERRNEPSGLTLRPVIVSVWPSSV